MVDAPERIWATHAHDGRLIGINDGEVSGWAEYVRADVAEAPSRTGAVKVGPLAHVIAEMLERAGEPRPNGDILHDILAQALPAALEPDAPMTGEDVRRIFKPLPEDELAVLREIDPDTWGHSTPAPEGQQPVANAPKARRLAEMAMDFLHHDADQETYDRHVEALTKKFARLTRSPADPNEICILTDALHTAGSRILGPDEVDPVEKALEQALDLLNSSLREMAPISAENHRRRVIEFIANARAIGRKP